MSNYLGDLNRAPIGLKIKRLNVSLILLTGAATFLGAFMLYGAADGSLTPWAGAHLARYFMGLGLLLFFAFIPLSIIYKLIHPLHILSIVLLILTALIGVTKKGSERWLNLGFMQFQPSEITKVTVILSLAKFYHEAYKHRIHPALHVIIPLLIFGIPAVLVLKQPDLGTALKVIFVGVTIMFLSGIRWLFFNLSALGVLISMPLIWIGMRPYQKGRVMTFLDPERDPLGKGYHISQAKIALGSGGMYGRGYMEGTQSKLEFLPEKHTDFAFTAFGEQFGFIGGICLLGLLSAIVANMMLMATKVRHIYGKLVIAGSAANFFFYIFINMGMVTGLLPVVGVPLPFISYGGTVMLTLMISLGLCMNAFIHDPD
jgi:rod shape determining protein RodA